METRIDEIEACMALLREQITAHISTTNGQFDKLEATFSEYKKGSESSFSAIHGHFTRINEDLIKAMEDNSKKSEEIKKSVSSLIDLERNIKGTFIVGSAVQKFMLWIVKWGFIGAGIAAGMMWVVDKFGTQ